MNRFFGRHLNKIRKPWQMYPIGVLFGLGFDTATEVALLVLAAGAGAAGLTWHAILCLPILFAAGMSLLDTIDGSFMNFCTRLENTERRQPGGSAALVSSTLCLITAPTALQISNHKRFPAPRRHRSAAPASSARAEGKPALDQVLKGRVARARVERQRTPVSARLGSDTRRPRKRYPFTPRAATASAWLVEA